MCRAGRWRPLAVGLHAEPSPHSLGRPFPAMQHDLTWDEFQRVELRAGTIVAVEEFPEARKPAYKIKADFGPELGIRQSSAQITTLYSRDELIGRQIIGVVNFPPKQIGPMRSEFLVTGFYRDDGAVVLAVPEREVPNGAKLG